MYKNFSFTFNNNMYQQRDGAAMGSLLGPVLAGITFVGLEKCMLPKLKNHLMFLQKGMI